MADVVDHTVTNFMDTIAILNDFDNENNASETCDFDLVKPVKKEYIPKVERLEESPEFIIEQLKKIKVLKQENNDLKYRRAKRNLFEIVVEKSDYSNSPIIPLKELLNTKKVVFLGLEKDYSKRHLITIKRI